MQSNYHSILGLYREYGKENGNCHSITGLYREHDNWGKYGHPIVYLFFTQICSPPKLFSSLVAQGQPTQASTTGTIFLSQYTIVVSVFFPFLPKYLIYPQDTHCGSLRFLVHCFVSPAWMCSRSMRNSCARSYMVQTGHIRGGFRRS